MAMLLFRSGSGLCRSIVPATEKLIVNLSEGLPASAVWIAARRLPGPESASEPTVRPICDGSQRSSSASNLGRKRALAGRCGARFCEARVDVRLRSQEVKTMMLLLARTGLRDEDNATGPGAQTERRGVASRRASAPEWVWRL